MHDTSDPRFLELVPKLARGELEPDERAWLDAELAHDPIARRELDCHLAFKQGLEERFDALPERDSGALLARVRADARAARPGLLDRLRGNGVRIGFAFAATVMLAQAIVLGMLLGRESSRIENPLGATRSAGALDAVGLIRVGFKPTVPEREMRLFLTGIGGRIVDGPSQLGDYIVRVAPERLPEARAALEQSALVDSFEPLTRAPGAE